MNTVLSSLIRPQQWTPTLYFQTELGWVSVGSVFTGKMAKFRRFLIPHTPIIILFSAVWSEEGWTLVLSSSSIFILPSLFDSKICQNWKPPCVKWHLICPKPRTQSPFPLASAHLVLTKGQEQTVVLTCIGWDSSPKYGPHYLPFHLSTEPNLSSTSKKKQVMEIRWR